jgi:hypothetical protein
MWLKQSSNQEGPNALKMSTDAVIPSSSPTKTEMGGTQKKKKEKKRETPQTSSSDCFSD